MITRLKVNGFKNLMDADIRFGPFTCIAGPNGVGKSNLFDAIHFLSLLSTMNVVDAALSLRDETGKTGDIRSLFNRVGTSYGERIDFVVEMIVPEEGIDDYGQKAVAAATFLRYSLSLEYKSSQKIASDRIEVIDEALERIPKKDAKSEILYPNKDDWFNSVVKGSSTVQNYLYTETSDNIRKVFLRQDRGGDTGNRPHKSGNPSQVPTSNLPRTVLSSINSSERPTVLMAKREMESWRQLRLEPSALRRPDQFSELRSTQGGSLDMDGGHLPATLYRLYQGERRDSVKSAIKNRLLELIGEPMNIDIDVDEIRQQLSLVARWSDDTTLPARSLSEGTLRFLALAVMEQDPKIQGVICLEEPENGIHPGKIDAMIDLLKDIVVDTDSPLGDENPLSQVIINTHSPSVVKLMDDDSLLIAETIPCFKEGIKYRKVIFSCIPNTWRSQIEGATTVSKGKLLDYLNPEPLGTPDSDTSLPQIPKFEQKSASYKPSPMKTRTDLFTPQLDLELPA